MPHSVSLYDTHAHIITDDVAAYPPAPISGRLRDGVLDRPMTAERLLDAMERHGVARAALVQRAHVYGYDNSYVLDAAARFPDRFGAICVLDSLAADAGVLAAAALDRGAIGVRLTERARGADGAWLHGPSARQVWEAVARARQTISIQLYTWNRVDRLPEIATIAADHGDTPVIVEHLSNFVETGLAPDYGIDPILQALAAIPNIYLKLTTINLGRCLTSGVDAGAVVRRLAGLFSSARLVWGSDVGQSPQGYDDMTAMGRAVVTGLADADRGAILSGTAERLFSR